MQLPRSHCSYQEMNYTLIVENERGDLVTQVDVVPRLSSDIVMVKQIIMSEDNINGNQNYSVRLRAEAQSQMVSSHKHFFGKLSKNPLTSCECTLRTQTLRSRKGIVSTCSLFILFTSGLFDILPKQILYNT